MVKVNTNLNSSLINSREAECEMMQCAREATDWVPMLIHCCEPSSGSLLKAPSGKQVTYKKFLKFSGAKI